MRDRRGVRGSRGGTEGVRGDSFAHVFVDESKSKGYVLAAAVVAGHDLVRRRKDVSSLVLPGQRRLHMTKERDSRRRLILARMTQWGLSALLVETRSAGRTDIDRRAAAVEALVAALSEQGPVQLYLESDRTQDARDRKQLHQLGARLPIGTFEYRHSKAADEPLLAVPDAIAWSWARGGVWRSEVRPLVTRVIRA